MSNQDSFRKFTRVLLLVLSCGVFHSSSPLFKRKSLIMKNISTGFGLCTIAAAVALYPVLDRFAPISKEAHAGVPVSAITSATLAQSAPTIVWYGTSEGTGYSADTHVTLVWRAWSDGKIEVKSGTLYSPCQMVNWPCSNWVVFSNPSQGYSAASDSNFDSKVDGADLAMLLGNWGDAPRDQIPISDCPLNLINP